jgi:hypothetical protein
MENRISPIRKILIIVIGVIFLLVLLNPSPRAFSEFAKGKHGKSSKTYRDSNYFIFSIYTCDYYNSHFDYLAFAGNFILL